ncbi:MAG TPA: hypothetical protein GXX37_10320 [Clostridiaceae bacterium]|nr:hypothetical protein [Clostridiaceae bacterium]
MLLPTIKLGDYEVTRLIIGGNPFSGNSHISPKKNEEMEDYFTTENIKRTLFRCEECGINTMQTRGDKHIFRMIREYRNEGGKLHWIAQTASEYLSYEGNITQILKYNPIAIYHHGTKTDALFKNGEFDQLKKRLAILRNTGKLVGLGTHMPEVVEYAEENNWDIDFYMVCVYNLSKVDRVSSEITGKLNENERFDDEDKPIMYKTIRATSKPCLVFKILGAGRKCESTEMVREAFKEAFDNIKATDAIVVGMFPKTKDQVYENANLVREILQAKQNP